MRTPDHTWIDLGQEKYYRPFIDGYFKILQTQLKQVKHIGHNYSYMTYTCEEAHDERNPNWKPFKLLWNYCERTGYDFFMLHRISYLSGWVENWFVSVRSSGMMKSAGEWSWKVCLGWILEDQEEGIWGWFSLLIGLIYWSAYICVLRLLISNLTVESHGMDYCNNFWNLRCHLRSPDK